VKERVIIVNGNQAVSTASQSILKTLSDLTYFYTHAQEYDLKTSSLVIYYTPHTTVWDIIYKGVLYWTPILPPRKSPYIDMGITFGTDVSIYASMSDAAMRLGLTESVWRHNTRVVPVVILLHMMKKSGVLGKSTDIILHKKFGLSIKVELKTDTGSVYVQSSGHMLNALRSILFRREDDKRYTPDWLATINRMLRNQDTDTSSLEPSYTGVSYHSWLEIASAVLGSAIIAALFLKQGIKIKRSSFILWKLVCRYILKRIKMNSRTDILIRREELREIDPRFGPIFR
jgi:hypothetical protein